MPAKPTMPSEPTQGQIEKRAYELFLARRCEHGRDVEDWLAAEQELRWRIFESCLAVASEIEKRRRRNITAVPDPAVTV
jgi:hypothetical protein